MDEYKSRLSDYLSGMIREELEKYDGGYTDEWNDQRKKNAEVLGYKLHGKNDIKEAKSRLQSLKDWGKMSDRERSDKIDKYYPKKTRLASLKIWQKLSDRERSDNIVKVMNESVNEGMTKYHIRLTDTPGWYGVWDKKGKQKFEGDKRYVMKHLKKLKTPMGTFGLKSLIKVADKYKGKDVTFDVVESVIKEAGMGILDTDQADVLQAIVMKNKNKNTKSILNVALKSGHFKGVDKKELLGYIDGARQFVKYMKSHPMESVKEDRDYKAEYKKYGSSTKAKKYRAELNQYNRKKGTYGNNDGKDASHKGGKIVGFEKESTNRGRREKSRLKKEDIREDIGSVAYLGGILKAMKKAKLKPKTAKVMKHGFSKSRDKIGFFIEVEQRGFDKKETFTLQLEVDRDGYLWYLSAPRDIKLGKWADTSQLVRGFKKLNMLPGFGQDAIFKRRVA